MLSWPEERRSEAALTAADFGAGCTGVVALGELGWLSTDLLDLMEDMRLAGVGSAPALALLAFGLRRFGPLARFLVMWVSSVPVPDSSDAELVTLIPDDLGLPDRGVVD